MFSKIHQKLGTAGFVISILALIVALGGAAYAALPGLNSKQKKEVKKIAKQLAGQDGAQGPQGNSGSAGAKGDQGTKGDTGAPGAPGLNGANGACSVGNNECVLPPGGTLTGVWAFKDQGTKHIVSISFPLRVIPHPTFALPENTQHCPGSAANPEAEPGYFCIYAEEEANTFLDFGFEPSFYGAFVEFAAPNAEQSSYGKGVWAVTQRCPTDPETGEEEQC
jgi:Collagen triple helix repeat (20 copies)